MDWNSRTTAVLVSTVLFIVSSGAGLAAPSPQQDLTPAQTSRHEATPHSTDYEAWLAKQPNEEPARRALGAVSDAHQTNRDQATESLTLAEAGELPAPLATAYAEVERAAREDLRAAEALRASPGLVRWVEKPENAATPPRPRWQSLALAGLPVLGWIVLGFSIIGGAAYAARRLRKVNLRSLLDPLRRRARDSWGQWLSFSGGTAITAYALFLAEEGRTAGALAGAAFLLTGVGLRAVMFLQQRPSRPPS